MSFATMNNDANTNAKDSRKRPREFHVGADSKEEEEEADTVVCADTTLVVAAATAAAAAAVALPPVTRLYKHALESIFGFLALVDIGTVSTVARSWYAAVESMAAANRDILFPAKMNILRVATSKLARHVGGLGSELDCFAPTPCLFFLVATRLQNLHTLFCDVTSFAGPMCFPPTLTKLDIQTPSSTTASQMNQLIPAIARVSTLVSVKMSSSVGPAEEVRLAPLAALPRLRQFGVIGNGFHSSHIAELRTMTHLDELVGITSHANMRCILRAPHNLQWKKIHINCPSALEVTTMVQSLPTVTHLSVHTVCTAAFASAAPHLHTLVLYNFAKMVDHPMCAAEEILTAHCAQLTDLHICESDVTSDHLRVMLAHMPVLRSLQLTELTELRFLSFLNLPSLADTLTSLTIQGCNITGHGFLSSELRFIFLLRELVNLHVDECCTDRVNAFTSRAFAIPCVSLPKLTHACVSRDL